MSSQAQEFARHYLTSEAGLFWRWAAEGDAIVWAGSRRTIVFWRELESVLKHQSRIRLPRFSAIILLLAACRDTWPDELDPDGELASRVRHYEQRGLASAAQSETLLADVLRMLGDVHGCAVQQPFSLDDKMLLLDMAFGRASSHFADQRDSDSLRSALEHGLFFDPAEGDEEAPASSDVFEFNQTLATLRTALRHFDPAAFALRRATGIDQEITAAPVEDEDAALPASTMARNLIRDLQHDKDAAGVATLASHLMAAVSLPKPISCPDAAPVGGVSDITNRGTPDRLLISELAHDDLTLATRVALNEALYLRRESPPEPPVMRRDVLIDTGLRMWGVPRIFAAASALAMVASADAKATVNIYRNNNDKLEEADLVSRPGLIEQMGSLSATDLPLEAGERFWQFQSEHDDDHPSQTVIITHADALSAPEARDLFTPPAGMLAYVVTVDEQGRFEIWSVSRLGRRRIQSARFDLEKLLADPGDSSESFKPEPVVDPKLGTRLPLIFSCKPFPLRVPHPAIVSRTSVHADHGVVSLTNDGRMLHWVQRGYGPVQLSDQMPQGKPLWRAIDDRGVLRALFGQSVKGRLPLISTNLRTGEISQIMLAPNKSTPLATFEHNGALMLAYKRSVEVFSVDSGLRIAMLALPYGVRPTLGRFFTDGNDWYAMSFDGRSARLDRVDLGDRSGNFQRGRILAMFDRRSLDGPWAITNKGWLMSLGAGKQLTFTRQLGSSPAVSAISHDGHRLEITSTKDDKTTARTRSVIDLQAGTTSALNSSHLEPRIARIVTEYPLLKRVNSIIVTQSHIYLTKPSARSDSAWVAASLSIANDKFQWSAAGYRQSIPPQPNQFGDAVRPAGRNIRLRRATWPDGSEALLDSRGLLHLCSSDETIPQITLVLDCSRSQVSGWASNGVRIGDPFYHGRNPRNDADEFIDILKRFVRKLRSV